MKKLNPFNLFEELKVSFFIWRNWIPFFYLKKLKVPFFIWRNWKSLFYLNPSILFEELKVPFFIWWNWIPFFYLKKLKVPFLTNWIIGQKSQKSARYAGAFWGKSCFLEEKTIKCPVLYTQFEEKLTFCDFLM